MNTGRQSKSYTCCVRGKIITVGVEYVYIWQVRRANHINYNLLNVFMIEFYISWPFTIQKRERKYIHGQCNNNWGIVSKKNLWLEKTPKLHGKSIQILQLVPLMLIHKMKDKLTCLIIWYFLNNLIIYQNNYCLDFCGKTWLVFWCLT